MAEAQEAASALARLRTKYVKLTRNARSLSGGAPRDIAERESKVGAGARSIEPFQVSGWRGARKAASYGLSIVLFG